MKKLLLFCAIALMSISCQSKSESKSLVVYFSATGTTEKVANDIVAATGAALWQIEPMEAYTAEDLDWRNAESRSSLEMADPEERPVIKMCTDIRPYDTIYLGFPIWWGICPRIIQSWIENNDLAGKRIILFATSGSSSIDGAVDFLRTTYPDYDWAKGVLLNSYTTDDLTHLAE